MNDSQLNCAEKSTEFNASDANSAGENANTAGKTVSSEMNSAGENAAEIADFRNKTVSVLGIGISNRPLIEWLRERGAIVTARDKKDEAALGEIAVQLQSEGVKLICGENYLDGITDEWIFKSPGIRFDNPKISAAVQNGSKLTSEMQLFFELCPAKIIGVTGSDGKTTTTTLISKMLEASGHRVFLGGNIGRPLLPLVGEMTADDFAVVELSSFQLHTLTRSPDVSVITNISPNHLDYHTGMDEYTDAKMNIYTHQGAAGRVVLNYKNPVTRGLAKLLAESGGAKADACRNAVNSENAGKEASAAEKSAGVAAESSIGAAAENCTKTAKITLFCAYPDENCFPPPASPADGDEWMRILTVKAGKYTVKAGEDEGATVEKDRENGGDNCKNAVKSGENVGCERVHVPVDAPENAPEWVKTCRLVYCQNGAIYMDSAQAQMQDHMCRHMDESCEASCEAGAEKACKSAAEAIMRRGDILLPGNHNLENYMAAIAAVRDFCTDEAIISVAKSFPGVEHRIEFVRELENVKYYNSSIDSSPTRTAAALNSFDRKLIVICGGYDKHIPFEPLASALCERAKAVVLTGATAEKIRQTIMLDPEFPSSGLEIAGGGDTSFEDAALIAKSLANKGDIVILSPACASFDAFRNFEERGNTFKSIVKSW